MTVKTKSGKLISDWIKERTLIEYSSRRLPRRRWKEFASEGLRAWLCSLGDLAAEFEKPRSIKASRELCVQVGQYVAAHALNYMLSFLIWQHHIKLRPEYYANLDVAANTLAFGLANCLEKVPRFAKKDKAYLMTAVRLCCREFYKQALPPLVHVSTVACITVEQATEHLTLKNLQWLGRQTLEYLASIMSSREEEIKYWAAEEAKAVNQCADSGQPSLIQNWQHESNQNSASA